MESVENLKFIVGSNMSLAGRLHALSATLVAFGLNDAAGKLDKVRKTLVKESALLHVTLINIERGNKMEKEESLLPGLKRALEIIELSEENLWGSDDPCELMKEMLETEIARNSHRDKEKVDRS